MLELWKARQARKAAVSIILPMVERTRFVNGRLPDSQWLDAYMVGFLIMLITLIAQRRVHSIGSEALGIVQADAWQEITGLPGELVGEETCLLSAIGHGDFERGCSNAADLVAAMATQRDLSAAGAYDPLFDGPATARPGGTQDDRDILALWSDYFERPMLHAPRLQEHHDPRG